jgi:hypothetical protein
MRENLQGVVDRIGQQMLELQPTAQAVGDDRRGRGGFDFFHQRPAKCDLFFVKVFLVPQAARHAAAIHLTADARDKAISG